MPASQRSRSVTAAYRQRVRAIRDRVVAQAEREWPAIESLDGSSWPTRMAAVVAAAQTEAVRAAAGYLTAYLSTETGRRQRAVAIDTRRYTGLSRDGRPLAKAFESPLIGVKAMIREAYEARPKLAEVGPERARGWLRGGTHGGLVRDRVLDLARKMEDGAWVPNEGRVMITRDGFVFDGQHRLEAVIESGMTVEMLVATGLPNPMKAGLARAKRMVGVDLDHAHRAALMDTLDADERFDGWQRATAGTCGACMALSGTSGKRFNFHPGCQCQPQPVVAGVRDRFPLPTAEQLFALLSHAEQDARFGPDKAEALRTGAMAFSALVVVNKLATGDDDFITEAPLDAAE